MGFGLCEHCRAEFQGATQRRRFCSDRCRKAAWTRKREDRETDMREAIKTLVKKAGMTAEDFA